MNERNELCRPSEEAGSRTLAEARPPQIHLPYYTSRYDNEAWEVSVRLPGVKKEDVRVTVENEILEVAAVRRLEVPQDWRPIGNHESERQWRLRLDVGPEVDESRISGKLEDGILTLRLPLRDEVKPRAIEIA